MKKYKFTWQWGAYYVDQPKFEGGEMYLASEVDANIADLWKALFEIADTQSIHTIGEMREIARKALGL